MLYTYECPEHGEFDMAMHLSEMQSEWPCPQCGKRSKKVIVCGHGGIHCDGINDVAWLPSAIQNLPDDAKDRVESRTDHKRYLKDHGMLAIG